MPSFSYKNCFAPVINSETRLLILGSLPGDASLAAGQYYAHPRNQFWPLLGSVLDCDLMALAYADRLAEIQKHHIGLWDIIAKAQRHGSLDANMRKPEFNQLDIILEQAPKLRFIACNGTESWKQTRKNYGNYLAEQRITLLQLPSSSPAYTLDLSKKQVAWSVLRESLQNLI